MIFALAFIIVSCSPSTETSVKPTYAYTIVPSQTEEAHTPIIPTATLKPATKTPSQTPSVTASASPTTTPVPPTATPVPTLSVTEAQSVMLNWLQTNGDCNLPCIWGLSPGVTDTQTRQAHLARFGSGPDYPVNRTNDNKNPGAVGYSEVTSDGLSVSFGLSYSEIDSIVDSLVLVTWPMRDGIVAFDELHYKELLGYYRLPQLLTNYGEPSDILIATWPPDPFLKADYDPFSIVVLYTEQGIMAEYIAPAKRVGDLYQGCPTQGYLTLRTWDPEQAIPLPKIAAMGAGVGIGENSIDYFKPIEEATSMTASEFFQVFKVPDNEICLETPIDLWPPP